MDRRLNKPLVLLMLVVALVLGLLLGTWTGIADKIFGGPNPKTIATESLELMRAENRLTVFAARYVSVVTSAEQRFGGLLNSQRTLILPGNVRYELDLSKLQPSDVVWDKPNNTLRVKMPEIEVAGPDVDINSVKEYGGGRRPVGDHQRQPAARPGQPRQRGAGLAQTGDRDGPDAARAPVGSSSDRAKLRDAARGGRVQGREGSRPLPDRRNRRSFLCRSFHPI